MRGRGYGLELNQKTARITPAYAGKRSTFGNNNSYKEDHPRVCGEETKKIP